MRGKGPSLNLSQCTNWCEGATQIALNDTLCAIWVECECLSQMKTFLRPVLGGKLLLPILPNLSSLRLLNSSRTAGVWPGNSFFSPVNHRLLTHDRTAILCAGDVAGALGAPSFSQHKLAILGCSPLCLSVLLAFGQFPRFKETSGFLGTASCRARSDMPDNLLSVLCRA